MAQDNLISISFTAAELTAIDNALATIRTTLAGKVINLTPEERKHYGKINIKRENWITRIRASILQDPTAKPSFLDLAEYDKDINARNAIQPRLNQIKAITHALEDTAMLISTDLYDNSLAVYGNVRELAKRNVPGMTAIYDDLKKQFPGKTGHKLGNVPVVK